MKKILFFLISLCVALSFCGCEAFNEALEQGSKANDDNPNSNNYKVRFKVGIFSVVEYPRATNLEREIQVKGRVVAINANPVFSSRNLRDARVVARPGNPDLCDLRFKLDRTGKLLWEQLTATNLDKEVIFMVDNKFEATFRPEMLENEKDDWITVRVGVNSYVAKGIAKFAKRNYDYYNPDASSWFNYL